MAYRTFTSFCSVILRVHTVALAIETAALSIAVLLAIALGILGIAVSSSVVLQTLLAQAISLAM